MKHDFVLHVNLLFKLYIHIYIYKIKKHNIPWQQITAANQCPLLQ